MSWSLAANGSEQEDDGFAEALVDFFKKWSHKVDNFWFSHPKVTVPNKTALTPPASGETAGSEAPSAQAAPSVSVEAKPVSDGAVTAGSDVDTKLDAQEDTVTTLTGETPEHKGTGEPVHGEPVGTDPHPAPSGDTVTLNSQEGSYGDDEEAPPKPFDPTGPTPAPEGDTVELSEQPGSYADGEEPPAPKEGE
jgi:hypothetical protein